MSGRGELAGAAVPTGAAPDARGRARGEGQGGAADAHHGEGENPARTEETPGGQAQEDQAGTQ